MKRLFTLLATITITLAACTDRNDTPNPTPPPISKIQKLDITKIETEASSDPASEVAVIGKEGFRIIEYDANSKEILQESIWKHTNGKWKPTTEIKAVEGDHITALYPSNTEQSNSKFTFKAGVNNMTSVIEINRKKSNKCSVIFRHEMSQVGFIITDKDGKQITFGDGNGQISKLTMLQPKEVEYDAYTAKPTKLGKSEAIELDMNATSHIIPNGNDYTVTATYKDKLGENHIFTYTSDNKFEKNNKYTIKLKIDTGEELRVIEVSVEVEEWKVKNIEGEFVKQEPDEPENPDESNWVKIPAGEFMMGSNNGEEDEAPAHKVVFTKPFLIGKYQVTFDEYDKYCEATDTPKPSDEGWGRGKRPVINVSWKEATAYCKWSGTRLPTEAEWEYACRAGTSTRYFWGDKVNDEYAWYADNSNEKTHPVGEKKPNNWGLYDMAGNVWEWCSDWYNDYPSEEQTNPQGPEKGYKKVYRGGSWFFTYPSLSSTYRAFNRTTSKSNYIGFRVVKDIK